MCYTCINVLRREEAYKNKFTNTKKECIRYFRSYSSFAATYTSEQINELLDKAKKDRVKSNKPSEKVLNITQIRASIQQKLKFKEIDKEACKFKAVNILLPILNEADNDGYGILDISDSESSDKDDNINQSTGNIQTVNDW
ncbi:14610_t:CDS:2 [Funneliformis geosporum]|uniref:14610_t:CDS:1 n=1 Tax=Funneliformis geosporum TaxID=1117311 RepID=A0A9W4SMR2_9GLOM|nr:14610_t:CDS:2 [Funneliformis geosporum]